VLFDGSGSSHGHPDRNIVWYEWDFDGDGVWDESGPASSTTHAYPAFGTYHAVLRVTDDNTPPRTDTDTDTVVVDQGNLPPMADANGPYVGEVGEPITLDGTGSYDPNEPCDEILAFAWDLDSDGVFDDAFGPAPTVPWGELDSLQPWPTDPVTGTPVQTIALRVTDSLGLADTATTTLAVYDNRPIAVATASPNPAPCDQDVTLDGSASHHGHPAHSIVAYEWDFDYDGIIFDVDATGPVVVHPYAPGVYTPGLRVTDDQARQEIESVPLEVHLVNHPPVADANGPYEVELHEPITLDGSGSYDPDEGTGCGDVILRYLWTVGGVPWDEPDPLLELPPHEVDALGPGLHPVELQVEDSHGELSPPSTTTLAIYDNRPVADAGPSQVAACDDLVVLDGSGSYHLHPAHSIVLYEWDFESDGTYDATGVVVSHSYLAPGSWPTRLRVTDDQGLTDTDDVVIVVFNRPPVADANGPYEIPAFSDLVLDASGSWDPDAPCGFDIVLYEWDLNDDGIPDLGDAHPVTMVDWPTLESLGLPWGVPVPVHLRVEDAEGGEDASDTTLMIWP
jgi:PKD repeat protein